MKPTETKHAENCKCAGCLGELYRKVLRGGDHPPKTKDTPNQELFGF